MKNPIAARTIVRVLRKHLEEATKDHMEASVSHFGCIATYNAWDDLNRDLVGKNPHDIGRASEREMRARIYLANMQEAYDFAVDTFLEGLEQ